VGYTITPNLGLQEADPATIQLFETTVFNANLNAIDTAFGADRGRLTPLENAAVKSVTDLDALILISASTFRGRIVYVANLAADFQSNGTTWAQASTAVVATTIIRDTEYAKATGAYKVVGARVTVGSLDFVYNGTVWAPVSGQMPYFNIVRDKVPSISNATDVQLESSYTWQSTPINRGGFIYSAGVVTVPFAGVYNIFASFAFAANATGSRRVQVTKNGASTGTNTILAGEIAGSSVSNSPAFVAGAVLLAANDTLAVSVWQNSGAALSAANFGDAHTPASSFFTIAMQSA
jgi:hypothetical protein